jgi:predicted ABC-type transport system involved in lysophospholipase L1 biosynthesis ATPase subunit
VPSSTSNAIRISYGVGARIALNEALVARIDVGFSDDETGQVYFVFGQAF